MIYYLREENRILREQTGSQQIPLTAGQRRKLAALGKTIGRKALVEVL